jgi:hypothetical protein
MSYDVLDLEATMCGPKIGLCSLAAGGWAGVIIIAEDGIQVERTNLRGGSGRADQVALTVGRWHGNVT